MMNAEELEEGAMRFAVANAALKYVDVPFAANGRSVHGLDCVGLLVVAARDCGIDVPDSLYGGVANEDSMLVGLEELCVKLPQGVRPRSGDICLMRSGRSRHHLAMLVFFEGGVPVVVHAQQQVGKVVVNRLEGSIALSVDSWWSWKELVSWRL